MTPAFLLLFIVTITLDVVGQLWFKLGLMGLPDKKDTDHFGIFWKGVFSTPLLWAGIGVYVVEFCLWLTLLGNAPLSFLFPLASLGYVGVLIASRVVLKETISPRRWAGATLITLGVSIVYIAGQS